MGINSILKNNTPEEIKKRTNKGSTDGGAALAALSEEEKVNAREKKRSADYKEKLLPDATQMKPYQREKLQSSLEGVKSSAASDVKKISDVLNQNEKNRLMEARDAEISGLYGKNVSNDFLMRKAAEIEKQIQGLRPSSYDENVEADRLNGLLKKILSVVEYRKNKRATKISQSREENAIDSIYSIHGNDFTWDDAEKIVAGNKQKLKNKDLTDSERIQLESENKVLEKYSFQLKDNGYKRLSGNYDFAIHSEPVSSPVKMSAKRFREDEEFIYGYVNDLNMINGKSVRDHVVLSEDYEWFTKLNNLTSEEVATYNYISKTQNKEAGRAYLEHLLPELNARAQQMLNEKIQRDIEKSNAKAALYSAGTVALAPVRAIEGAAASVEDLGKVIMRKRIDPYSNSHSLGNTVSAIRGATAGKIDNFWGQFFYNTGMSVADNVVNTLTFGGITKAVGGSMGAPADAIANATSNVVSAAMASDSVANAIVNNKQRGMSDKKALALAFAQGFVEYGTEKLSLDAILREPKTSFTKLLKAANAEGTEEVASGSFNLVTDLIFNGSEAEIIADIKKLQDKGYRDFDAAMFGVLGHLGEAYLSGAVSGAAMSAGYNATFNRNNTAGEVEGDDVYYLIEHDDNNVPFVVVENDVLDGLDAKQKEAKVKEVLKDRFSQGVQVGNELIKVNRMTRDEVINSEYSRILKKKNPDLYNAKLNALTETDDVIRASRNYINEGLKHERKDNIIDFARGTVNLRIGGKDYRAEVVVGTTSGDNLVLYDVVRVDETVISSHKKKKAVPVIAEKDKSLTAVGSEQPSINSIPQSKENSNKNVDAFDEVIAMGTNEHAEIARKKIAQVQGESNNEVLNSIEDVSDSGATGKQSVNLTPEQQELKGKFEHTVGRIGYIVISEPKRIVPKGTIGYVDFTNKEIYISPGHFSESLLTHELTHVIDRGYNGKYVKSLISFFKEQLPSDWNEKYDEVKAKYEGIAKKNADFTYTESTLEAETLAEMCSEFTTDEYISMAESLEVSTIKQICLMLRYMGSKIKMLFGDESRAHKMKIASLKWQMALYKATKKSGTDSGSGIYYGNTNLTNEDLPEYLNVGRKQHTRNKKKRMMEAGKKPILTTSIEIKKFISDVIHGNAMGEVRAFGKVGKRLADAIRVKLSTLDLYGSYIEINADDIRESYKMHSTPKENGDIPLSEVDFEKIPEYLDNFTGVLGVNTYNGKVEIHIYTQTEDGYVRILTVASKERNSLQVTKLIGVSKEKFERKYAKKIERGIGSPRGQKDSNPSTTARHTADALSNNSIPQNSEKDNKNISTNDDMLMAVSDDEGSAGVDTSAIEEEISIIDEALKDESLPSSDRVALIKDKVRLMRKRDGGRDAAGKEDTARTKKLEDGVTAYRESGDTSGIPTRRSVAASKKYYDAKAADIEAELKQIDEALSNSENLSDMEYDELRNRRDALLTQWREAAKKNSVLAEVSDILDEIDTAARPNHTWVNEIAGWLSDKKNLIKYGTYNLNDIERNFKIFFGEHFKKAYDKIIQPLYDSKKAYTEGVTEYANRLKREIVDGLGIKKGSKMSAAVMWLGEGQKPVSKKDGAELAPYTYKDCVDEFGADAAKKIQKATEIFREMYDELLDQVNETRAMLYPNNPDKLIPKREDYFRHFQEMSQGFEGLKNILQTNIGIDPMLVGVSENTKPKSKWQSYAQHRLGNSTTYDAVGGFLDYLPAAQYSIHIDPNIVNVRSLAYDLASAKAAENNGNGNPNANGFIAYLQRYANSLAGKTTSHFDRAIQDSNFGRTAMAVVSWLNNKTKASAVLGNINSVLSQVTNIKNVIGKIEHQSDVMQGAIDALAGINPNSEIAARYDDSGFLKERYLDRVFSQFDSGWQKVNPVKWAADLLGFADEIGTRITWNAAYNEAVRKNVENPVQYADNFTRSCVAGRGIGEEALVFKSQVAKMFLPFRTEVLNDLRVQQDILFGTNDEGNSPKVIKRVKNIMQLYVASMVINAVLAAIKSDEFDPLDEAKEGYEENGPLGALAAVMEDYANGTGNPVAFDPIYDIVSGIYQGATEGESAGGKVGRSAQRVVQNLTGDLVSNNPFSTAVMGMIGFDNDASDLLFNGNVYVPGGMGMPLAGNVATVLRELGQGDYASAAAATVKPFLPLGTQIDRSIKGIYDYTKGYATNEAAYERMTGQDGDLKYLIEPGFGNAVRSVLFGPGAFSGESDAFYNDKTRKFTPEEQAEILSHKDYESRKVTFDDILAMNVYDSERDERKQAAAEEFFLGKEGTVLYNLYMSGIEAAVPYKNMAGDTSFTDSKTGKKYTLDLKADELEKLTGEVSDKIASRFARANESEVFASLPQEEQEKYLEAVASAEHKQAKIKALYENGQMDYDDYFRLESNYMESEAKRDRVLYVDDAQNYAKYNAADVVGQYISYSDFPVSEEGYEQLKQWRDYATTRKPDDVDAELLRLSVATGSDINVSGNPYGIISYTKSKVDYKIEMPDNQIYVLCDEVDKAVRSALSALFAKATYRNATAEIQKDLVASVKRDVRDGIKDKYKARYRSVKVDEFDRIVNMKR